MRAIPIFVEEGLWSIVIVESTPDILRHGYFATLNLLRAALVAEKLLMISVRI